MPKYDYKCIQCDTIIEVSHKMSETPEIICEECGSLMQRILSAGATHTSKTLARKLLPRQYAEIYDKYKDKGRK